MNKKRNGVLAGPFRDPIKKEVASPFPFATKSVYPEKPAKGTPMKFTKSFPANAHGQSKCT